VSTAPTVIDEAFEREARDASNALKVNGSAITSERARMVAGVAKLEALQAEPAPPDRWDNPDWSLLDDRRGDLPHFPLDTLTAEWVAWLDKAAHGAGVTPAHVMVPLLSIAPSLIGTARRVSAARSWSEPMTQWGVIVGFSGTGKTPGIDVTRRALSLIAKGRQHKIGSGRMRRAPRHRRPPTRNGRRRYRTPSTMARRRQSGRPRLRRSASSSRPASTCQRRP
jgi:hypothetical protein